MCTISYEYYLDELWVQVLSKPDASSPKAAASNVPSSVASSDLTSSAPSSDLVSSAASSGFPDIPPDVDFDTSDDLMIAQMLQKQFDKEYDLALANEEKSYNRNSKVTVTYSKYRMIPEEFKCFDSSDDDDEDEEQR